MNDKRFLRYCAELISKYSYPYMWLDLSKKIDYAALKFPLSGVKKDAT